MREYGELYLPHENEKPKRRHNGKFVKGVSPFNKGKKWNEYLSEEAQKGSARGWANLIKYRAHPHDDPNYIDPKCKAVIGIFPDGKWKWFVSVTSAAKETGCTHSNVSTTCIRNKNNAWSRFFGEHNNHKSKGIRFYWEDDVTWTEKINQ